MIKCSIIPYGVVTSSNVEEIDNWDKLEEKVREMKEEDCVNRIKID